jgi:hypothetical protein
MASDRFRHYPRHACMVARACEPGEAALMAPAAVHAMRWPSSQCSTEGTPASPGFTRTYTRMLPRSSCTCGSKKLHSRIGTHFPWLPQSLHLVLNHPLQLAMALPAAVALRHNGQFRRAPNQAHTWLCSRRRAEASRDSAARLSVSSASCARQNRQHASEPSPRQPSLSVAQVLPAPAAPHSPQPSLLQARGSQ